MGSLRLRIWGMDAWLSGLVLRARWTSGWCAVRLAAVAIAKLRGVGCVVVRELNKGGRARSEGSR